MDRRLLPDRIDDRGADLWPAGRLVRPPPADVRGARRFHYRVAAVCGLAQHRAADVGPRAAGPWRRRADDVVSGAGRRSDSSARAGTLPGLPRRGRGLRQYVWSGGRRLSDRAIRLAIDLSGQPADRLGRGRAHLAAAQLEDGAAGLAGRSGRPHPFHGVRCNDAALLGAGPARQSECAAAGRRPVRGGPGGAGLADRPREPDTIAAHSARAAAPAGYLAQRRLGRMPWRRPGFLDYVPSGLSASGAGRFAVGDRILAGPAHHWNRNSDRW